MTTKNIATLEKELNMRIAATGHLSGIPKIQNQSAIERLYDQLTNAHIAMLESA